MKINWIFPDTTIYLYVIGTLIIKGKGILSVLGIVILVIILIDKIRQAIEENKKKRFY